MRRILISILLIMFAVSGSTMGNDSLKSDFDLKINHLVREQMYSLGVVFSPYKDFTIEAEYGYRYYHRFGLGVGYRFINEGYSPYLILGYYHNRDHFSGSMKYDDYAARLGAGLETNLTKDKKVFFNFDFSLLNYTSSKYSDTQNQIKVKYDFGESFDYAVSFGIGYRFNF